jgi:hypothetical protein
MAWDTSDAVVVRLAASLLLTRPGLNAGSTRAWLGGLEEVKE